MGRTAPSGQACLANPRRSSRRAMRVSGVTEASTLPPNSVFTRATASATAPGSITAEVGSGASPPRPWPAPAARSWNCRRQRCPVAGAMIHSSSVPSSV